MHPIWLFPSNIWTHDSKLRRKFPKVLDLETCLLSEKAARRGLAREAMKLKERKKLRKEIKRRIKKEIKSRMNYFFLLV